MKRLIVVVMALSVGCDSSDTSTPSPVVSTSPPAATTDNTKAKTPEKLEDMSFLLDAVVYPASGGQGDYLVSDRGVWLLRGGEAVRVKEVPSLSNDVPWTPTTQSTQTVRIPITVRQDW